MKQTTYFGVPDNKPDLLRTWSRELLAAVAAKRESGQHDDTNQLLCERSELLSVFAEMIDRFFAVQEMREQLHQPQMNTVFPGLVDAARQFLDGYDNLLGHVWHNLRAAELLYKVAEAALDAARLDLFTRSLNRIEATRRLAMEELKGIDLEQVQNLLTDFAFCNIVP